MLFLLANTLACVTVSLTLNFVDWKRVSICLFILLVVYFVKPKLSFAVQLVFLDLPSPDSKKVFNLPADKHTCS